jgi:aryl-alcohol dehydrogenase-like predicted oxidoreductase
METITLGASSLRVSPIAFGTWQLGGDWGSFDEQAAIDAIRFARAQGVNLFDTAQAYGFGAAERLLGEALRDDLDHRRDEVVIATKGGLRIDDDRGLVRDSSPAWLREGVESSLRALGVDHIDLYQVHWPDSDTPYEESAAALDELVGEGKIRHVGVSNYSRGRSRSSPTPGRWRRLSRRTRSSTATSRPTCCPTPASTTSAYWCTARWPTGC